MTLIEQAQEPCTLLEKHSISDGEGGFITIWEDSAEFVAAIIPDTTTRAIIAEKQGLSKIFRVTTPKNALLSFRDIFRRDRDGKVFRVTSDGSDEQTPPNSGLPPFSRVTAEEYTLPVE